MNQKSTIPTLTKVKAGIEQVLAELSTISYEQNPDDYIEIMDRFFTSKIGFVIFG